ncbi:hypothetical protein [Jannaschia sp. R86511]|uniref:hypothetical protein n=1 Tax=Jannaschia sp. R86511 TaxID=3093853 RepID=UPI0036D2F32A
MRFVPFAGLVMSSPVLLQVAEGTRPLHEALGVWLVAMLLAMAGWWLWSAATRPSPVQHLPVVPLDGEPRRRREDGPR